MTGSCSTSDFTMGTIILIVPLLSWDECPILGPSSPLCHGTKCDGVSTLSTWYPGPWQLALTWYRSRDPSVSKGHINYFKMAKCWLRSCDNWQAQFSSLLSVSGPLIDCYVYYYTQCHNTVLYCCIISNLYSWIAC